MNEKRQAKAARYGGECGRGQHLRQWKENWFTLDRLVITEGQENDFDLNNRGAACALGRRCVRLRD